MIVLGQVEQRQPVNHDRVLKAQVRRIRHEALCQTEAMGAPRLRRRNGRWQTLSGDQVWRDA